MGKFIFYDEGDGFEMDEDFEFVNDDDEDDYKIENQETAQEDDADFKEYEKYNDGLQPFGYMYIGGFIAMALSNLF